MVQAENEALQLLVMEVAQNKQDAQHKVSGLKQKYSNLLAKVIDVRLQSILCRQDKLMLPARMAWQHATLASYSGCIGPTSA